MTPKEIESALDNYFKHTAFNVAVTHRNDLIGQYNALFDTLSGMQYSDMPKNPTPQDGVLNTVCRVDEMAERLKQRIDSAQASINKLMAQDEKIECMWPKLRGVEYAIIVLRHGQSKVMSFYDIADEVHRSVERTQHIYYETLKKISAILA